MFDCSVESADVRAVASAVSSVCVVGSASNASKRPESNVSAAARVLASEESAVPVVGSASKLSKRLDNAESAFVRAVASAASAAALAAASVFKSTCRVAIFPAFVAMPDKSTALI